jgi:hypothetical protein
MSGPGFPSRHPLGSGDLEADNNEKYTEDFRITPSLTSPVVRWWLREVLIHCL